MKSLITVFLLFVTLTLPAQNFTVVDSLPEGAYGNSAWGDYNNDGFKDLIYISQVLPTTVSNIYSWNGAGMSLVQALPGLYNAGVCWGDLNNDGFDDLVMNGLDDSTLINVTYIYQSMGNGNFNQIPHSIPGLSAGSVDLADYNNDGLKDIAVTGFDFLGVHEAYIFRNDGNWNFTDINAAIDGIHFGELKWGDFDNDSLKDLLVAGIGNMNHFTHIYKNMGADSFQLLNIYMKGASGTADWCDFDNDGWQDVLITGTDSTSTMSFTELHHNNHNGTFTVINGALPDFGEPSAVAIADYNSDGIKDVVLMGGNFSFVASAICMGMGNNVFNTQPFLQADVTNTIAANGDFDHDGDEDLLLSNYILRNDFVTSVTEHSAADDVLLWQHDEMISIQSSKMITEVELYNLSAQCIFKTSVHNNVFSFPANGLKAGCYLVKSMLSAESVVTKKIVIY